MYFKQEGDISTLNAKPLKLVDQFTYLGINISSTEKNVNIRIEKSQTVIDQLSIIWKSDLFEKINGVFNQAVSVLVLLYRCTIWTQTERMEKA